MNKLFNNRLVVALFGLTLTIILGIIDYITGYDLGFFVFYFVPISIVSWKTGRFWGISISIASAFIWGLVDYYSGHPYSHPLYYLWNSAIRLIAFIILAVSIDMVHVSMRRQRELTDEVTRTLAEVKRLRGFLPICASCKKIRNDDGYWEWIEKYISEHSEAEFTHGICPECAERLYPELWKKME